MWSARGGYCSTSLDLTPQIVELGPVINPRNFSLGTQHGALAPLPFQPPTFDNGYIETSKLLA